MDLGTSRQLGLDYERAAIAWKYYRRHPGEIEQLIWLNDVAGNVPTGAAPPAAVIVAGLLLGWDDATVREAFDPPLPPEAPAAA